MRVFGYLVALVVACATALPVHAQPLPPSAAIDVPPLDYRARTLANGARIYTIRDPSASVASINAWYEVGQRDDPVGRGGFAHLFEHLMFKTTRNLPQGVSAFITEIGGSTNASTLFDYTGYYITAPANQLEALIWLEGERLRNLVVDEASFNSERDVVKEELRQRIFAQPYGRILYTLIPAFTFSQHPYARPIGGTIADLDQATLADVRAFHEAYYRPDNAVFVISGNFDPAAVDSWVDRHIGSVARPSGSIPRDNRSESAPLEARTIDAFAPNVPLPALIHAWRAPAADDPDAAGLALIEALLTRGSAGRLRRRLVDDLRLASNVSSFNLPARDGHAFALVVTLAPERSLDEVEQALAAELARLRDTPVGAAELAAAKNGMLGDALSRRETARGRAFELGGGVMMDGSAEFEDRRLARIRALQSADIQRVARRLLDERRRIAIRYQDEARRPAGYAGDVPPNISQMGTTVPPAARPPVTIASAAERQPPPAPSAVIARSAPVLAERRLANGLRVVSARSSDVPLVTLTLVIGGGDAADPAGKSGLADLLAAVALRGAGGRDSAAIAEQVAALGGFLGASAEPDATHLTLTVPAANAEAAGRLLADIAMRPDLAEAELAGAREQQVAALAVAARQPMQTALRFLSQSVFAGSPYGAVPTAESLAAVSREDLASAHRAAWGPRNATLVVAGALGAEETESLARRLFGDWDAPAPALAPLSPLAAVPPRVIAVDMPGAGQTAVLSALPAAGRASPDWAPLQVVNARLGGGQQGFLSQEIRVRRGLSYGAGSLIDARHGAPVVMTATQTRNEAADEVVGLVLEQLGRLTGEPISAEDTAERAAFVANGLASRTERTAGLADYLAGLVTSGVPIDAAPAELLGQSPVTAEAVRRVAARYFDPAAATIVVAGDSGIWIEALRERFPQLELVGVDGTPIG